MDAAYVKEMINNPDQVPNNTLNRWIDYAQLYHYKTRHVPAAHFIAIKGLSRKEPKPNKVPEGPKSFEEEIENKMI